MKKIGLIPLIVMLLTASMAFAADEIHWTFTGPNSVAFDWRGSPTEKTIGYGLTSGVYTQVTATTPNPAPVSTRGSFWEANLTGLTASTLYYYKIGTEPEQAFRTPPVPGSSDFNVYALGNIGSSSTYFNTGAVQDIIDNDRPAFVLGLGDLTLGSINGKADIDQHFNDVMAWSKEAAYLPVWGDLEWISSSTDSFKNYKGRFTVPNSQTSPVSPLAGGKDWYWFDYGNTRFITLPEPWSGAWSAWNATAGDLMAQAQADPNIKFIATFGHRPAYSSGHYSGSATLKGMLDKLGDTYSKYTLNINGHSNNYERSLPQHGVTHVTVGTGGANLTQDGTCLWSTCRKPDWSAFRAMHLGALKLHFTGSGIVGSFICGPAGSGENDVNCTKGSVVDNFTIASPTVTVVHNAIVAPVATVAASAAALPDVIVTSLSYANGVFTSVVKNQGTAATPAGVYVGLAYSVDGSYKTWGSVMGPLAVGASVTVGTNGGSYVIPTGTHTITAWVDDVNRFAELNETNNTLSLAALPDVIVTSLSYANGVFTSVVKNQGTAATPTGVAVGLAYSVDGSYKTWGSIMGPLAVGASVTIGTNGGSYIISTGTHTITAWVDDVNRFEELNETNNILSQTVTDIDTQAPTVPNGLVAKPQSSSQINLSWAASTDNVGVTGYKIYRNGSQVGTTVTTAYSDSGLMAGTSYSYTVTAYDATGNNSGKSAAVSATTTSSLPNDSVIQGFAAVSGVTGGAGGRNIVVTNLNENGAGSLKAAITSSGTRTITFTPGLTGTINWTGVVYVDYPDMTIDGAGAHITISGMSLSIFKSNTTPVHNIIIRNLTFAFNNQNRNSINIEYGTYNVWIDHNTFHDNSWNNDITGQGLNIWNTGGTNLPGWTGITVSWNHFKAPNPKSLLIGSESDTDITNMRVSVHHNWFDNVYARNPRVHGKGILVHAWNNYVYSWSEYGMGVSQGSDLLAENNYFENTNAAYKVAINGEYATPTYPKSNSTNASGNFLGGNPTPTMLLIGTFPRYLLTYNAVLETANDTLKTRIMASAGAH